MAGPVVGFHCSHERHAPLAASAGFTAAMCSDHFHPWSERQGHSGFAWSWLGAALAATPLSFGTVCAPGQRYHPAIIAQGADTLAEMFPGRFWLAVGSGEALNESITGTRWPSRDERNARLKASVDAMRLLWAGDAVTTKRAGVPPASVAARLRVSSDIERHAAWLQDDAARGYERIYLHNVARDHQERFIAACGERLLPALAHVD